MLRIAVMVSGGGTNLQAIIDGVKDKTITNTQIAAVISNNANEELKAGEDNKITITVTAEDGSKKAYNINIKREALTSDATLKSLEIEEAEKCFKSAHERGIKKVGLYDYMGHIYMKKNDFENAKINFLIAAGKEERISSYYKNYLKCLSKEEIEAEEQVLKELQDYNLSLFRLALLEQHKGNMETARTILEKLEKDETTQLRLKKSIKDELNEIYSIKR